MDCAGFERDLERLLSGELDAAERAERLRELRRHARQCVACSGAEEVLNWLELPRAERDIADDPGQAYWRQFNERIRRRIEADPARHAGLARGRMRWAAVAAVLLVAAAAAVWWRMPPDSGGPVQTGGEAGARDELIDPDYLDEGWAGSFEDDGGWVYPDTEDLDPAARRELLEWLRERESEARGVS